MEKLRLELWPSCPIISIARMVSGDPKFHPEMERSDGKERLLGKALSQVPDAVP